jgi:hypothetical protein
MSIKLLYLIISWLLEASLQLSTPQQWDTLKLMHSFDTAEQFSAMEWIPTETKIVAGTIEGRFIIFAPNQPIEFLRIENSLTEINNKFNFIKNIPTTSKIIVANRYRNLDTS